MTWLQRFRPVLFVVGGLLVVGSLLGARLLAHGSGSGSGTTPAPAPTNGSTGTGPVVLGLVDTDPRPIEVGLPPVMASGEVAKVYVAAGDAVKAGDKLYSFDSTLLEADQATAEAAVVTAKAKVREAKGGVEQYLQKIRLQVEKEKGAQLKLYLTHENLRVYEANLRSKLKGNFPQSEIDKTVSEDAKRLELDTAFRTADQELRVEKATLEALETEAHNTQTVVDEAEAEVKRYETLARKAKSAVEMATVRARLAGVVERVNISPGDVMGISTRAPAMIIIPDVPRIVRAEVEADFAHRVTTDMLGRTVTIYDNTDPKITYKGTVKRIGSAFLPKRSTGDGFVQNETRALEAVIEVIDPAPAGEPPLRVGQKVRVNFGQ